MSSSVAVVVLQDEHNQSRTSMQASWILAFRAAMQIRRFKLFNSIGFFPDQFKSGSLLPRLKQSNLDKDDLGNYRPISHRSISSQRTERVAKSSLFDYLSTNNLLNSFQSAYIKFHSTETILLSGHDHIINALSNQQVTCLTLLDLSAAFDIIDHSILLDCLSSWFLAFLLLLSLGSNFIYQSVLYMHSQY